MATAPLTEERAGTTDSRLIARNSLVLLGRYLAIWGANILLVLFLPRYLGAQGLGQLQFAQSFVALFSVAVGLGVRQYIIKEVARDQAQMHHLLGSAMGLRLLLAGVVLAAIAVVTEFSGHSETARRVIYFIVLWMIIRSFAHLMSTFLYGSESMGKASLGEIVNKIVVAVVGITLLVMGADVVVYAGVMVLGAVVEFGVGAWFVRRLTRLRIDVNRQRMKTLVIGGMPFLMMGFLLNVYTHTDIVMLRFLTSEEVVGWHSAGFQIYRSLEFLPVVLTTALLPTLARMYKSGTPETPFVSARSIGVVLLVMVPVGVGMSLVARELIAFMPYPSTFSNTVPVLTVLALSSPITALLIVFGTIAAAVDRQVAWAIAMVGTVSANIALNALAIPYFQDAYGNGGIGAATVTLMSEALMVTIGIWLVPKGMFNRHLALMVLRVGASASIMTAGVLAAKTLGLGLFPLVGVGVAIYGLLVVVTQAVTRQDIAFLKSTISRGSGKDSPREPL
ncbi:MAG: flippase [Dehalococcoidia bacterium]